MHETALEELYVEHESLTARSSGLPDADGPWRSLCVECFPDSPRKAIPLVY
jgi:hypothetical protein